MQLLDEKIHSVTKLDKKLKNKIHDFEKQYYDDNDDDVDNISYPTPPCMAQHMLNETYYYSTQTSTTACPRSSGLQFHTPNQHHQTTSARGSRSGTKTNYHWNHRLDGCGVGDDSHCRQYSSDSFIRCRGGGEGAMQNNSHCHRWSTSYYDCGERWEAVQRRQQALADFENVDTTDHQKEQQQNEHHYRTPMSRDDDTFGNSVDSLPLNFRRTLWKASTPSQCNDASSRYSESADSPRHGEMNALVRDCIDQGTRTPGDEKINCSENSASENDEEDQEQQLQADGTSGDSFNEESFYIGAEEGLAMFDSIEESDISETDVSGESSYESYSVDESDTVLSKNAESMSKHRDSGESSYSSFSVDESDVVQDEYVGSLSKRRDIDSLHSQCENVQCLENRSMLQLSMEESERMKNELERLKATHFEQTKLLIVKHTDELERLRAEMVSTASCLLEVEHSNIDTLNHELACISALNSKLLVQHEVMQVEYSAELSSLEKNKREVEDQVQSLQMKMEEMIQSYLDETCNLKASFGAQTALVTAHVSLVKSMNEDFESKLYEKNREIEIIEQTHREYTAIHTKQSSQHASQLASTIAAKSHLDDTNTKLASIACEKDGLASNLATAHADTDSLLVEITRNEAEKGSINQQLETVRTERDDLLVQVARLKDTLAEAVAGDVNIESSLNDETSEIMRQSDHIASIETERKSLSYQITELKKELASPNVHCTIKDFERKVNEKKNELAENAKQFRKISAKHAGQVSQLESQWASAINEKEKIEAQLYTVQVTKLKNLLDESINEKITIKVGLDDARHEIECRSNRINALEMERLSQLSQIRELEQQITANDALLKSIQDDLDSKSTEHATQASQLKGLLKSAVSENELLKERNQILVRDLECTNTKFASVACENDCLVSNLATAHAENEALLSQVTRVVHEKAAIEQQFDIVRTERDDLLLQVAKLKDSLDKAVVAKDTTEDSLDDARRENALQKNHIDSMETEKLPYSNKVLEMEQHLAAKNALFKSIQDDFKLTTEENDRELVAVRHQLQVNATEHAIQVSGLESELTSAIEARELFDAQLGDTNTHSSVITCENIRLGSNHATAQVDYTTLASQVTCIENKRDGIEQQLAKVCAERDDLLVQVTNLKGSLGDASTENDFVLPSPNDTTQQVEFRNDRIASMETERISLTNQITELERQIASQSVFIEKLSMEAAEQSNNVINLQHSLTSKDKRLVELSTSNDDLVNKYLLLVKEHQDGILEKDKLAVEQSSMISSLEAQLSNFEVEKSKFLNQLDVSCRVLKAKEDEIAALTEKLAVAETALRELKEQNETSTLTKTDLKVEHLESLEMNDANDQSSATVPESDSVVDSRPQTGTRFKRIQDLDHSIASMNSDSQDLLDKIDNFQELAAKLAVSVLKLKLQGNKCDDLMMMKDKASFNDQFLALSEKGTELRWLYAKVMDRTGVLFDLRQENDQLMKENMMMLREYQSTAAAIEVDRTLIELLQSENKRLTEINSDFVTEKEAASKLRSQLVCAEEALSELRAAMLHVDSSLEKALQDKYRLSDQVDLLHDSIAILENEKKCLTDCIMSNTASDVISREDLDHVRTFMAKAQQITENSERERKLLEQEVERLRADLQRAKEELTSAREDSLTMSRMRNAVSQSRILLEKAEREKNQLEFNLMNIREEMEQIQKAASQSYNSIIEQSKDEIMKLKMENEYIKSLMSGSIATSLGSNHRQTVISQISSVERFKIQKGQSMFDLLKGTKKSGRKDNVKYRRTEE